ncbi:hypothetical protein HCA69_12145 [Listeria grandensis]|uniref:Bacterial Ig domain-containing protein n=1 Tax=Listeria grandensis TaxID=1494963 RepID=A0A7X0Y5D0_9LIST|nr:immunoglobulin-like domain-containing protein [Listeria grandensis]MBC1937123.1 hypothetical protein [Listeria grandensis]
MIKMKISVSKKMGVAIVTTAMVLAPISMSNLGQPIHGFAAEKSVAPARPSVTKITYIPDDYWGVIVTIHADPNMRVWLNYNRDGGNFASSIRTDAIGNATFSIPSSVTDNKFILSPQSDDFTYGESLYVSFETGKNLPSIKLAKDLVEGDSVVKGIGTPGAKVTMKSSSATVITTIVDATGNFTLTIPKYNGVLDYTMVQELNGLTSGELKLYGLKKLATPLVSALLENDTTIKGSSHPYTDVIVSAGGKQIGKGMSNAQGSFAIAIPKQTAGTQVSVIQKAYNIYSDPALITTSKSLATLTPSLYTSGSAYIRGTYTGAIVKARVSVNGQVLPVFGGNFSNGSFSYYVGSSAIKKGDTVNIVGYNSNDLPVTSLQTISTNF